jgi:NAD(P)-dependent dehydrogenase (short-subunit alcohol dehydrogenase family)
VVDLSGQVALVTGASRGIGAATASALAAAGAAVVLAARDGAACTALARRLEAEGGRALGLACDVADFEGVARTVAAARERFGPVTILINNAGTISPIGRVLDCDPEDWTANLRVNLGGAFACAQAVLPGLLAAGGGTIVNISSGAAHRPLEGWSAYCAGKAGLAMLTQALDLEYREQGLWVFGFAPGVVDTEMQGAIRGSGLNPVSRLSRADLAPPERPAALIAWLCGPTAAALAGRELSIDDPDLQARVGSEAAAGE